MIHADAGDWPAALATFEEALAARERIGDVGRTRVARWMVGWALRNLGRTDEALAVQTALKAELEAAGEEDPYVDEELALLRGMTCRALRRTVGHDVAQRSPPSLVCSRCCARLAYALGLGAQQARPSRRATGSSTRTRHRHTAQDPTARPIEAIAADLRRLGTRFHALTRTRRTPRSRRCAAATTARWPSAAPRSG